MDDDDSPKQARAPSFSVSERQFSGIAARLTSARQLIRESALKQSYQAELERSLAVAVKELDAAHDELVRQQANLSAMSRDLEFERRRYQELFELAPEAYVVTTTDGLIVEANRAAHELFNVPDRRLEGRLIGVYLLSHAERPVVAAEMARIAVSGPQRREWLGRLRRRNADTHDVAVAVAGVRHPDTNDVVGARWILRDVSAWILAESEVRRLNVALEKRVEERTDELARRTEELGQRTHEAETANQAKAQFLAAMSHEIRTPLNAICGYAELLEMELHGPLTTRQSEFVQRIRRASSHLLRLLNDVLNFAKLQASRIEFETERVPLDAALDAAHAIVDAQAIGKGVQLVHLSAGHEIAAFADQDKVVQIILNLLTNAVKFTAVGGRITSICGESADEVWIEVRDTGYGIPANRIEQVFKPFVQLDRVSAGIGHGVGLGLAISRDLARGMSGDLTAESVVREGSVFRISLRPFRGAAPVT
jgi:PAS domain S-box-containing protein